MRRVSVFMDVEDPINSLADDAALRLAELFSRAGIRGSFCVTGEKCRVLGERGRTDVVEALGRHCLGLHTDTHSCHPTTIELLADLAYEEGCQAVFSAESRGVAAFKATFDREPCFWGGAGNTWGPEIAHALRQLNIRAYSYALTALPAHAVHRFDGVIALPQALSVSEVEWMDDQLAKSASRRTLDRLDSNAQPWIGIFVGHPTRMRYSRFWDAPYANGRTPSEPEQSDPVSDAEYERAITNLGRFLEDLSAVAQVVGVDEATNLEWAFRAPTPMEAEFFRERTAENLRAATAWPIHRPCLNAEGIVAKTLALAHTVEVGFLAERENDEHL